MTVGGMRVLMPSIVDPAIKRGGAWTVTRGLVDMMRRDPWNADVTTLVPPEPGWRRVRQATSLGAAPWTGVPAKVRFLRSRAFRDHVRRHLRRQAFDLLVINGSDLLWCLDDAPAGCRALAIVHNREAALLADQIAATFPRAPVVRRILQRECARLHAFEVAGLRGVEAAIFLSARDATEFSREIPSLEHMVLPPQFAEPPERIEKAFSGRLELGFLANFAWWPNRDGLNWFVRDILDRIRGDVRLHLFGHRSREMFSRHPRVVVHGFVDDLREVWATCDWMVIPIQRGAGVSVKAAESLYHGMPVLSTELGLRGLPPIVHPQIVQYDAAADWVSFLSGPESRALCGSRLPIEVSGHFDLRANTSRLDAFLARVLEVPAHAH
jgi:glycosyltransferase involved in cell wall biosynthesis